SHLTADAHGQIREFLAPEHIDAAAPGPHGLPQGLGIESVRGDGPHPGDDHALFVSHSRCPCPLIMMSTVSERRIFPPTVRGSRSSTSMRRGTNCGASRALACSSSAALPPGSPG